MKRNILPSTAEVEQELKREQYKQRYKKTLKSTVFALITAAAVAVLVATLWMPVLQIFGTSMTPTLQEGQIVICAKTEKMKFGHRGANQPVKRLSDGRTFITAQNRGYAIVKDSLPEGAVLSMENANDHACEGVEYPALRAFGVDFYPATGSSANSTAYLYNNFINAMGGI